MNKELFKVELTKQGIELSEQQNEQFAYYFKRLVEQNKLHNLTSITDEEGVYEKHFFDSISVGFGFDLNNLDVLDVGSGGGFPGMPLRIAFPNMKLSILDSTAKKIVFLDNLAKEMELENVTPIVARAEEYKDKKFDVVTARGVANLTMLLELVCNLVKKDGYFVAMKGSKYQEELDAASNAIKVLGYKLVKKTEYKLPDEDSSRCNLYFKKVKDHENKYPRNFGTMKKKPL